MSIFEFISNKFNKVAKNSFVNSSVVYNGEDNFIILVILSEDYLPDACEFMDACKNNIKFSFKCFSKTFLLKDNKKVEKDRMYYLLISGDDDDYCSLFYNIDSLSNKILKEIARDIYNNRNNYYYKKLVHDKVLKINSFTDIDRIKYNEACDGIEVIDGNGKNIKYDDVSFIASKLPEVITIIDILDKLYMYGTNHKISIYKMCVKANDDSEKYATLLANPNMFKSLSNENLTVQNIVKICSTPKYTYDDEYVLNRLKDYAFGELDTNDAYYEVTDDYDKFTGITENTVDIDFVDVDEVLEDIE